MNYLGLWAILLVGMAVELQCLSIEGESMQLGSMEMDPKPQRPRVFTSPEELRTYLEALSRYYAVAGRPRFGKRGGSYSLPAPANPAAALRKPPSSRGVFGNLPPFDIYDVLMNNEI